MSSSSNIAVKQCSGISFYVDATNSITVERRVCMLCSQRLGPEYEQLVFVCNCCDGNDPSTILCAECVHNKDARNANASASSSLSTSSSSPVCQVEYCLLDCPGHPQTLRPYQIRAHNERLKVCSYSRAQPQQHFLADAIYDTAPVGAHTTHPRVVVGGVYVYCSVCGCMSHQSCVYDCATCPTPLSFCQACMVEMTHHVLRNDDLASVYQQQRCVCSDVDSQSVGVRVKKGDST